MYISSEISCIIQVTRSFLLKTCHPYSPDSVAQRPKHLRPLPTPSRPSSSHRPSPSNPISPVSPSCPLPHRPATEPTTTDSPSFSAPASNSLACFGDPRASRRPVVPPPPTFQSRASDLNRCPRPHRRPTSDQVQPSQSRHSRPHSPPLP